MPSWLAAFLPGLVAAAPISISHSFADTNYLKDFHEQWSYDQHSQAGHDKHFDVGDHGGRSGSR